MNTEGGSVILRGGIFDGIFSYSSSLSSLLDDNYVYEKLDGSIFSGNIEK